MKYLCGHDGCDVCGARACAGMMLHNVGDCIVCEFCMVKAVKLAIHVAESFSVCIDVDKPCGNSANVEVSRER